MVKVHPTEDSFMNGLFQQVKRSKLNISATGPTFGDEFSTYLAAAMAPKDVDVLNFWKTNRGSYPMLATVSRIILALQATNTASERTNSVGTAVVSAQRHSLTHHNTETLIWLKRNKSFVL